MKVPTLDVSTIKLDQRPLRGTIDLSFSVESDARAPAWASWVEAKTNRRDWIRVGLASADPTSPEDTRRHLSWRPEEFDFHPGDEIQHRVVIYAGALAPTEASLGTVIFDPWWARLWRHYRTDIIAFATPLGAFLLYAGGLCLVLLFAPARLAGIGSASFDQIPAPTGNIAFVWSLWRKFWENVALLWLCRNGRVRRAWARDYAAGRRRLSDLGKFARESFVNELEILDAWVSRRLATARDSLQALDLFAPRRSFVPLPVRVGTTKLIERPDAAALREMFSRRRAVVCIIGGGGCGKSTLACAIARWAMSDDPAERLLPHRMIPLFIVQDTTEFQTTVTQTLRRMLGDEELPDDLVRGLLAQQRLLVIVDALSEREPATQRHVEEIFAQAAIYNAIVITSRSEPTLGALDRTMLYPTLLDEKRIVPFITDYVAKLDNAEALQGGRTLRQLGDRILEIAEKNGEARSVTPLLVKKYVDIAMSRALAGSGLDRLPQDVPEIFVDYLKRVCAVPETDLPAVIQAAQILARVSLGTRLVPADFYPGKADAALAEAGLGGSAPTLLTALVSGGVIERRNLAGGIVLRFALDPVAEYLAAIQFVSDLRDIEQHDVVTRLDALTGVSGYPAACDGYLRAITICFKAYREDFGLPDLTLPWDAKEQACLKV